MVHTEAIVVNSLITTCGGGLPPSTGHILIDGADVTELPQAARVKRGLALLNDGLGDGRLAGAIRGIGHCVLLHGTAKALYSSQCAEYA